MITPLDIQNKEFSKSFKGYKDLEVDSFLDELTVDYEKLFKENVELKDKVGMLTDQVKHYSSIEQTIQKTLVMAQTTAEEVTLNAKKKSESIIEDAEKECRRRAESGNEELKKIKDEYERIRKEMMLYKARCKSIINSQLEMIEGELEEFSIDRDEKAEKLIDSEELESIVVEGVELKNIPSVEGEDDNSTVEVGIESEKAEIIE